VRLHAYHGERLLNRSPGLAALAAIASLHHERCDGSGYHRGLDARSLPEPARLLAAADVYHAMLEPRPHRPARSAEEAAAELRLESRRGRLDADAVEHVLVAAGQRPRRRREHVAGLTQRPRTLGLAVERLDRLPVAVVEPRHGPAVALEPGVVGLPVVEIGGQDRAGCCPPVAVGADDVDRSVHVADLELREQGHSIAADVAPPVTRAEAAAEPAVAEDRP